MPGANGAIRSGWGSALAVCLAAWLVLCAAAAPLAAQDEGHAAETGEAEAPAEAHDEHGGASGQVNPVAIDPDLAIFTALVFLLLLAILGKFAWRPIIDALDRREQAVAEQIASAQAMRDEAQRMLAEHQAQLAGAAEQVKQMLDQARREADLTKQQVIAEAQQAAAAEKRRALSEIDAAKNSALSELAERTVDSALGLASKIVRR